MQRGELVEVEECVVWRWYSRELRNFVVLRNVSLCFEKMAERTGLEPATPGVTGRYSNQLNYRSGVDA